MRTRSKGILFSYLKIIINMVCGVVLSSVLLRRLGDTEYGIYQTVAAFANYLILLEFGVGTVMVRNVSLCRGRGASQEEIERNISTTWTLTCMLSCVLLAVSVLFYCLIPRMYSRTMTPEQIRHGQEIFVVVTGHLFLNFLMHTVNAVIFSYEDYGYGSLQSIWKTLARTILLVVLLLWCRNAMVIAVVDLVVGAVCLAVSFAYCRRKLKIKLCLGKCDSAILRTSIPLAIAVFLQGIVNQTNNNVDKFLIGIILSPESVTLYSVALYIYSVFSSLVYVASYMYIPAVTQKVSQGCQGRELADQLVTPSRLTALTGGLVLFGFVGVGRQFIEILYGEAYLAAWLLAVLLIAPAYIDSVVGVLVNVLDAMNKRMARSVVLIATTAMNVVLSIFCLKYWGIFGAAAATAVCTLVGPVLIMSIYYKKVIRIPILWLFGRAFKGILIYLLVGCGAALAVGSLIANNYVSFLLGGVVFVGISVGGYYFLGTDREEKETIRRLLRTILKRV